MALKFDPQALAGVVPDDSTAATGIEAGSLAAQDIGGLLGVGLDKLFTKVGSKRAAQGKGGHFALKAANEHVDNLELQMTEVQNDSKLNNQEKINKILSLQNKRNEYIGNLNKGMHGEFSQFLDKDLNESIYGSDTANIQDNGRAIFRGSSVLLPTKDNKSNIEDVIKNHPELEATLKRFRFGEGKKLDDLSSNEKIMLSMEMSAIKDPLQFAQSLRNGELVLTTKQKMTLFNRLKVHDNFDDEDISSLSQLVWNGRLPTDFKSMSKEDQYTVSSQMKHYKSDDFGAYLDKGQKSFLDMVLYGNSAGTDLQGDPKNRKFTDFYNNLSDKDKFAISEYEKGEISFDRLPKSIKKAYRQNKKRNYRLSKGKKTKDKVVNVGGTSYSMGEDGNLEKIIGGTDNRKQIKDADGNWKWVNMFASDEDGNISYNPEWGEIANDDIFDDITDSFTNRDKKEDKYLDSSIHALVSGDIDNFGDNWASGRDLYDRNKEWMNQEIENLQTNAFDMELARQRKLLTGTETDADGKTIADYSRLLSDKNTLPFLRRKYRKLKENLELQIQNKIKIPNDFKWEEFDSDGDGKSDFHSITEQATINQEAIGNNISKIGTSVKDYHNLKRVRQGKKVYGKWQDDLMTSAKNTAESEGHLYSGMLDYVKLPDGKWGPGYKTKHRIIPINEKPFENWSKLPGWDATKFKGGKGVGLSGGDTAAGNKFRQILLDKDWAKLSKSKLHQLGEAMVAQYNFGDNLDDSKDKISEIPPEMQGLMGYYMSIRIAKKEFDEAYDKKQAQKSYKKFGIY